jgi:hypothetical protein
VSWGGDRWVWSNDAIMIINRGKLKHLEKTDYSATSSTMNLIRNHLGMNPDLHSEKPACSCLNYLFSSPSIIGVIKSVVMKWTATGCPLESGNWTLRSQH